MSRLIGLGEEFAHQGMYREAAAKYDEALSLAQKAADKRMQLRCLCPLGEYRRLLGETDAARSNFALCQSLSMELRDPLQTGKALRGLGDLERTLGNNDLARQHYGEARSLFQKVGNQDRPGRADLLRVLRDR